MAINIGLVHVGQAIEEVLRLKQITQAQFAEMLNITQPSVNALLKKSSIDTERLKVISLKLDYNFFEDFCPDLKEKKEKQPEIKTESENAFIKELLAQLAHLRQENENKTEEIKKLHTIIDTFTSLRNEEAPNSKKIGSA